MRQKAKNFAEADKIRDDLKAQGIEVADVRGGAALETDLICTKEEL